MRVSDVKQNGRMIKRFGVKIFYIRVAEKKQMGSSCISEVVRRYVSHERAGRNEGASPSDDGSCLCLCQRENLAEKPVPC